MIIMIKMMMMITMLFMILYLSHNIILHQIGKCSFDDDDNNGDK